MLQLAHIFFWYNRFCSGASSSFQWARSVRDFNFVHVVVDPLLLSAIAHGPLAGIVHRRSRGRCDHSRRDDRRFELQGLLQALLHESSAHQACDCAPGIQAAQRYHYKCGVGGRSRRPLSRHRLRALRRSSSVYSLHKRGSHIHPDCHSRQPARADLARGRATRPWAVTTRTLAQQRKRIFQVRRKM